METAQNIQEIICKQMPDAWVQVNDPMQDGAHLEAIVVSEQFIGMSLLSQQRKVMNFLKSAFETSLHALKLQTFTPEAWKKYQENPS